LINVPFDKHSNVGGVGINTNNPLAELDVNGDIRAHNLTLAIT
jgi:hypothetical protein